MGRQAEMCGTSSTSLPLQRRVFAFLDRRGSTEVTSVNVWAETDKANLEGKHKEPPKCDTITISDTIISPYNQVAAGLRYCKSISR